MNTRTAFTFCSFLFGLTCSLAEAKTFDLSTANIAEINAATDAGALSSEKLVQLYLNRIEAYDKTGPSINSVLFLNESALAEATLGYRSAFGLARHSRHGEGFN
jgi:hypothetical protein